MSSYLPLAPHYGVKPHSVLFAPFCRQTRGILLPMFFVGCMVVQWSSAQNPLDEYSAGFIPINYLRKDDPCTDPTPCDQSSKIIKFFCVWDGQGPGILFHDMCFVDEFNCHFAITARPMQRLPHKGLEAGIHWLLIVSPLCISGDGKSLRSGVPNVIRVQSVICRFFTVTSKE
uniref:Uncharacterized protein n=1 Tax=Timema bartmani TaxID=61472 RepID=A0A7R9ETP0_9NEOP|nr:unnamed protein product [Timema bartmani]